VFDSARHKWAQTPGEYTFLVGGSSQSLALKQIVQLK